MTNIYAILMVELVIILLVPLICKKIHIPSIVGFIFMGVLLGPHCLKIIPFSSSIDVFGKLGILYIMFQVGIDLDKNVFHFYRKDALIFGVFSFLFPFSLGMLAGMFVLHYSLYPAMLLGAVLGSHTLMTYPIVSHYGVQRHSSVNVIVGGTIVAVMLSLSVLAFVKDRFLYGELREMRMLTMLIIFVFVALFVMPLILHHILKYGKHKDLELLLIMLCLVSCAWLADVAGLDSILGAYICGLALNGLVPQRSSLMSKIHFIGDSFLVPLFLIGVGMIIDISSFLSSTHTFLIAILLIIIKLTGKGLAALGIKTLRHFSSSDGFMIWGMTQAASAGTIAIITIGFNLGIFDESILDAGVVMICVLCTSASFLTEHVSKKIQQADSIKEINNPGNTWILLSFQKNSIKELRELAVLSHINETEEVCCNSWQNLYHIISQTDNPALLYRCRQSLNTIKRLVVALPKNIEQEADFLICFDMLRSLSGQIGAPVVFYTNQQTQQAISDLCNHGGRYLRYSVHEMDDWEDMLIIVKKIKINDLIIIFSSLPASHSYHPLFAKLPTQLDKFFTTLNYFVIFPGKKNNTDNSIYPKSNDSQSQHDNLSLISLLKHIQRRIKRKLQYG